jgi:glycosyltransferase involved in cell wall biosynthesis
MAPAALTYQEWLRHREPDAAALRRQRKASRSLTSPPRFSIVLASGDASLGAILDETLAQTYDRWELVVLDLGLDADSLDAVVARIARESTTGEPRIRLLPPDTEQSLLPASLNRAVAATSGEWLVFLDQDDALAPNALYEIAVAANQAVPGLAKTGGRALPTLVYSDADAIFPDGTARGIHCSSRNGRPSCSSPQTTLDASRFGGTRSRRLVALTRRAKAPTSGTSSCAASSTRSSPVAFHGSSFMAA